MRLQTCAQNACKLNIQYALLGRSSVATNNQVSVTFNEKLFKADEAAFLAVMFASAITLKARARSPTYTPSLCISIKRDFYKQLAQ